MKIAVTFCILCVILVAALSTWGFLHLFERSLQRLKAHGSYVERLTLPEFVPKKFRTVVSLTTIPGRVKHIPSIVDDLKKQIYEVDQIYVCIPYHSRRKNILYPTLPDDWNPDPKVRVVRCQDFGPATKLLGCVAFEKDPNTRIITIDDDHTYEPKTIKTLVNYSQHFPSYCVAFQAMDQNLRGASCPKYVNPSESLVGYLEGFGGALYVRRYITPEMIEFYQTLPMSSFLSDDLTISTWLQMQNVKLMKICDLVPQRRNNKIDAIDALHNLDRKNTYQTAKREMDLLQYRRHLIWVKSYNYLSDRFEPYTKQKGLPALNPKTFGNTHASDIICIRGYQLRDFIDKIFKNISHPIILVTCDAVTTMPSDIWPTRPNALQVANGYGVSKKSPSMSFSSFLKDDRLLHWFAQNLEDVALTNANGNKITSLPIGIDYHTLDYTKNNHPFSQERELIGVVRSLPPLASRPLKVSANFHFNNSSKRWSGIFGEDRSVIAERMRNNPNVVLQKEKLDRSRTWKDHGNYSFVLSPEGMGLDCHRTWEALILSCIPIVRRGPMTRVYDGLPVVLVDSWSEITHENLVKWKDRYSRDFDSLHPKLTTSYWQKQFQKHKMLYPYERA